MQRALLILAAWTCGACSPAPPPDVPSPVPRPTSSATPKPSAGPTDSDVELDAYGKAFVRAYGKELGTRVDAWGPGDVEDVQHWVLQYEAKDNPHRFVTVGLGRQEQPHAYGNTPKRVELLAEVARDQEADVVHVLSRLGGFLHSAERTPGDRFKAFDTLRSTEPLLGMRFFILIPFGEVTLFDRDVIAVLRVIPMPEEEYVFVKMRGDGAARAWWHRHRRDPALARRWRAAAPLPEL